MNGTVAWLDFADLPNFDFALPIARIIDAHILGVPQEIDGWVSVLRVVDGDTVVVRFDDGAEETLRYIGIDAPETVHPRRGVDCFGPEASARNTELVEGRRVALERDVSQRDRYGRLLRYVYTEDGAMVNARLVAEGYAQVATFPPDVKHADLLRRLQGEARERDAGLWGACRDRVNAARRPCRTPAAIWTARTSRARTESPLGVVERKNMSYTQWWYYLPKEPVRLA